MSGVGDRGKILCGVWSNKVLFNTVRLVHTVKFRPPRGCTVPYCVVAEIKLSL